MKKWINIITLCCVFVLILHPVIAPAQELSTILEMVDHIEKRLDEMESVSKSEFTQLKNEMNGQPLSDASNLTELSSRLDAVEVALNQALKQANLTEIDSTVHMLVSRTAELDERLVKFEGSNEDDTKATDSALIDDLRHLTNELRQTIGKASSVKNLAPEKFTPEVKAYFNYKHDGSEGDGQSNAFDFNRVYIGGKYQISEKFMARYLTDIGHESKTGKFEVFTKYAYLDWNLGFWKAHAIFGLQGTQSWKAAEKAWGYRVIRKSPLESFGDFYKSAMKSYVHQLEDWSETLIETTGGDDPTTEDLANSAAFQIKASNFSVGARSKMGSSADIGLALTMKPTSKTYANFMMINGTGYKKAEDDMYKTMQVRTGAYLLNGDMHVSALIEVEPWRGVNENGHSQRYNNVLWDLFVSYEKKNLFIVGLNSSLKQFDDASEGINARCYSVFGNIHLKKKQLKILARFDNYVTGFNNTGSMAGFGSLKSNANLIVIGLDWMPDKRVNIIPNFQMMTYENDGIPSVKNYFVHMQYKL